MLLDIWAHFTNRTDYGTNRTDNGTKKISEMCYAVETDDKFGCRRSGLHRIGMPGIPPETELAYSTKLD